MPWNIPNLWLSPSLARCNCWLNIGHNYGNIYLPSVLSVCHRRILWNSTESPNHQKTNFNNSFHSTFQQTWLKLSKSGCDRWRCREFKRFDGFLEFQWFGITFFYLFLFKEGCNWGHVLSAAIKLGTPEPGFWSKTDINSPKHNLCLVPHQKKWLDQKKLQMIKKLI